ncbi:S-layer protein domain-containing protein, partial [Methanohalobium sp.]|uniref:S-layer protein domain-containing protein n=1 Tax=Methanohalobium sp. TaxID=2837493 RepID=UPI00397CE8E6
MALALLVGTNPISAQSDTVDSVELKSSIYNMHADNITLNVNGTESSNSLKVSLKDFNDWRSFNNDLKITYDDNESNWTASYNDQEISVDAPDNGNAKIALKGACQETPQIQFETYDVTGFNDGDSVNTDKLFNLKIDADDFATFWYDHNDNISSETIKINISETESERSLSDDSNSLIYESEIQKDIKSKKYGKLKHSFDKIGFLAEDYVPIKGDVSKLCKLAMHSGASRTVKTGETIKLKDGYAVTPQQIDVDGNKVWLELTKDGEKIDDKVIDMDDEDTTWAYKQDIMGEEDVVTLKFYVDEVFQGQADSIAVIEGFWQIDDEGIELETEDTYGNMEIDSLDDGTIKMVLNNSITLDKGDTQNLMENIYFNTADSDDVRFYMKNKITTTGTYDVRGAVANESDFNIGNGWINWTPKGEENYSFAEFWYDLDDDKFSETLSVYVDDVDNNNRELDDDPNNNRESDIIYKSEIQKDIKSKKYGKLKHSFDKIGFLAEDYVPIKGDVSKLCKLAMHSGASRTVKTGETIKLKDGYAVTPQQIDVDGNKVWLELTKDGEKIDDKVIDMDDEDTTWAYKQDIMGEEDVVTLKFYVDEVFQGQADSIAVIEGFWQIDDEGIELETEDTYGNMEIDSLDDGTIKMVLNNSITLDKGDTQNLMENIYFNTADSDDVRFYPYVEKTVADEESSDTSSESKEENDVES